MMGFWMIVIMVAISIGMSYAFRPKMKTGPGAKAATEFDVPTAEEGRPIAVIFGTKRISGPNVVWYGDIKTQAIKR